jgi:hypothetical protein
MSGGTYGLDVNGAAEGTQYGQVLVTSGNVDLGNGVATLTLGSTGYTPGTGDFIWILNNSGTGATSGYFNGLSEGSMVSIGGADFYIYYNAQYGTTNLTGGNDVVLAAVPEPAALGILVGGAALGILRKNKH